MTSDSSALRPVAYHRSPTLSEEALNELVAAAWPGHQERPYVHVLARSLAWIGATAGGELVGFVNVAWDGGEHAFLLDTTVRPDHRRGGVGTELVRRAVQAAREGGAAWMHVDYEPRLDAFYRGCGFRPTAAGLIGLTPDKR